MINNYNKFLSIFLLLTSGLLINGMECPSDMDTSDNEDSNYYSGAESDQDKYEDIEDTDYNSVDTNNDTDLSSSLNSLAYEYVDILSKQMEKNDILAALVYNILQDQDELTPKPIMSKLETLAQFFDKLEALNDFKTKIMSHAADLFDEIITRTISLLGEKNNNEGALFIRHSIEQVCSSNDNWLVKINNLFEAFELGVELSLLDKTIIASLISYATDKIQRMVWELNSVKSGETLITKRNIKKQDQISLRRLLTELKQQLELIDQNDDLIISKTLLIKKISPINKTLKEKALLIAFKNELDSFANWLIEAGASTDATNSDGVILLARAVKKNKTALARFLLKNGAPANICDISGDTPLILAIKSDNIPMAQLLLEFDADINIPKQFGRSNRPNQSPLVIAISQGSMSLVKFLIDNGAYSKNIQEKDNNIPLRTAIDHKEQEILKLLLQGIDLSETNYTTLLHYAIGNKEAAEILLEHGVQVNGQDADGDTPLLLATKCHALISIIELFIKNKAEVNIIDKAGNTPFMNLVSRSPVIYSKKNYRAPQELIKASYLFLGFGTIRHIANNNSETVVSIARKRELLDVVDIIENYDPEIPSLKQIIIAYIKLNLGTFKSKLGILPIELSQELN